MIEEYKLTKPETPIKEPIKGYSGSVIDKLSREIARKLRGYREDVYLPKDRLEI